MSTIDAETVSTRDRLLLAAADLLDAAQGGEVSTRAICEAAGVQAPTLYHHFGNKQNLLDAVITHGFKAFLAQRAAAPAQAGSDPIDDIRRGWDLHVRYGIENPNFYSRIYGRAVPGQPCGVVAEVEAMILEALRPAAAQRRLRVPPEHAARQILAASTGVVLTLISQPPETIDLALSDDVRDAILARISTPADRRRRVDPDSAPLASGAIALRSALKDDIGPLTDAEAALLDEWLGRLSVS
jgi:AcrR family transcriptional regulator